MHGYQVPLFPANPLTKHSFQFNQDNSARWMAPASWVFLGKGQRGNGVFLNKKYSYQPSKVWTERCCAEHWWASGPHPAGSETLRVISVCCCHNLFTEGMCENQAWGFVRQGSVCFCPGGICPQMASCIFSLPSHRVQGPALWLVLVNQGDYSLGTLSFVLFIQYSF